jgi:putative cell wall-binding protein/predicted outer membrane lipoprotein
MRLRSVLVLVLAFALLLGVMPASAFGVVTGVFWERHIGGPGTTDGTFSKLRDVAVDKWGYVYAASENQIQMFSPTGGFIKKVGAYADNAEIDNPVSIAVDRWGNVYVGEAGIAGRIHMYFAGLSADSDRIWDGHEDYNRIDNPQGIGVALDTRVYLSDTTYDELQCWTSYGSFMESRPPIGPDTTGLAVSHEDRVFTTISEGPDVTDVVAVYDWWGGAATDTWGGTGTANGKFLKPWDVDVDPTEIVYVIEKDGNRGQVFSADGGFMTKFGSVGSGNGQFLSPEGIGLGLDHTLYVADTGNDRISKWNVSAPPVLTEIAGDTRITTAVEAALEAYPRGAPCVIIATGYNWPDALGGVALAGAANGPILLTAKDYLPAAVRDALVNHLHPEKIYVLGSEAAVSLAVENTLKGLSTHDEFERLGGVDRYETAIKISREVKQLRGSRYDGTAFVCTGADFPDALSAAPIAAANGWPIYLTRPDYLPSNVSAAMLEVYGGNPSNHGYIIGSEAAVSEDVEDTLATLPFMGFGRIGGANRYETSAMLADKAFDGMGMLWSRLGLATGTRFPDALAGGVLQGDDCSVLLLTRPDLLSPPAASLLAANKKSIYQVRFFGDENAISTVTRNQVRGVLGLPY